MALLDRCGYTSASSCCRTPSMPPLVKRIVLRSVAMVHEIARLVLEQADTFLSRQEAIRTALDMGMPLNEIEDYLDWLDIVQRKPESDEEAAQGE